MKNLKELLEEKEELTKESRKIRDKHRKLNLLDRDHRKQKIEREEEWKDWTNRFRVNFEAIKKLEKGM